MLQYDPRSLIANEQSKSEWLLVHEVDDVDQTVDHFLPHLFMVTVAVAQGHQLTGHALLENLAGDDGVGHHHVVDESHSVYGYLVGRTGADKEGVDAVQYS